MAQSSPQRRRYLAARRRGLTQSEAITEVGVSRSSAWRYDQILHAQEAQRAEVRQRYASHPTDGEDALRAAADKDVEIAGPIPMPPWEGPARPADDPLVEDGSFPSGLLERRMRVQEASSLPLQHPMFNRRAVTVGHGEMPLSEDMGGRLSRPTPMPEEPAMFLGGVV
jgi:hypothetical protein